MGKKTDALRRYIGIYRFRRPLGHTPRPVSLKPLAIAPVGAVEQAGAARLLRRFSDRDLTLTDAVGLHLMQARKVKSCWSTDSHLGLTGVSLVVNEN
ncbi:MAG: hypothetical protein ACREVH_12510 [Gammaproteobacteria bacterium]